VTSCQAQTCTHLLNSIQGTIYHKLWGEWLWISRWRWCWCWGWWIWCCRCDGDASRYAKEESVVTMAAILLQWQQQISPSRDWRWVPPSPPPQKIMGKIGHPFFSKTKAYIRIWRWYDARGANELWWRGLPSGSRHPCPFQPRDSSRLLPPLQMLLVVKYWSCKNPWSNWGPEGS
jgi:hypothetical protein